MKAFLSTKHTDGDGSNLGGPCEPCFRRNLFGGLAVPTGPQRACQIEAERVAAETMGGALVVEHRLLPGLLAWDLQPMRDLADALAAVIPVLGEMEMEAGTGSR